MICSNCRSEVADGVSFCPRCGNKIESGMARSGLKLAATIEPENPSPAQGNPYGGAPAGGMPYGYNGSPVVPEMMINSAQNMAYSSISMDANEPLMDLDEYYRKDCPPKTKQFVKTSYIILYALGIINFIIAFMALGSGDLIMWKSTKGEGYLYIDPTWSLIGGAVLIIGAIGVHKLKSRAFAVAVLAFALFQTIRNLSLTGRFSGWLLLLGGAYAVYGTWMLHKDYDSYRTMKTIIR